MSEILDAGSKKSYPAEIVLGKCLGGGGYCCTNIGPADVFLLIMPKLKECFKSDMASVPNAPAWSNEMSPAVVEFYGDDGKVVATYRREVFVNVPIGASPSLSVGYANTAVHNVITFGDSEDVGKFVEKCRELSHGGLDHVFQLAGF